MDTGVCVLLILLTLNPLLLRNYRLQLFTVNDIEPSANIESSPIWDISCLAELIYDLIIRQLL